MVVKRGYTVYDIGRGNGSISVEAALQIESTGTMMLARNPVTIISVKKI